MQATGELHDDWVDTTLWVCVCVCFIEGVICEREWFKFCWCFMHMGMVVWVVIFKGLGIWVDES
jgi:hypothetical protein